MFCWMCVLALWCVSVPFVCSDLYISRRQLELYLTEYEEVPYDMMTFMISHINYGGRITDRMDARAIQVILQVRVCPCYLWGSLAMCLCVF